MQRPE